MAANGDHRWVRLVPSFLQHHNSQVVTGTNLVRNSISQANFMELLQQLYHTETPAMQFTIGTNEGYPDEIARLLFRFDVGDAVILARRSDFSLVDRQKWEKVSTEGSFGPRVHFVARRLGRNSKKNVLVPAYELRDLRGTLFYEFELKRARYADADFDAEKQKRSMRLKRLRRKRQLEKK